MRQLEATVRHYVAEWDSPGWALAFHRLIEMGPVIVPELERHFVRSRDGAFRAELIVMAGQLRSDAALDLLQAALQDRVAEVWKAALDGMVGLASPGAVRVLGEAVGRPAPGVDHGEWSAWVTEAFDQASAARAASGGE